MLVASAAQSGRRVSSRARGESEEMLARRLARPVRQGCAIERERGRERGEHACLLPGRAFK